jgi:DNA-binding transcriptional regulator YdaS (Cro superfamily)
MNQASTTSRSAMLKKDAAAMLGVSPSRVSQLIRHGHLRPEPDGTITPEEVERCRRQEPIGWQPPYLKSGRRPAAR